MKIKVVGVGKIKESYLVAGIEEYAKRLKKYTKLEIVEVPDESIPDNCSLATETIIKSKEGRKVLDKIKQDEYVILLDLEGEEIGSVQLAEKIAKCMIDGKSNITFVIGGSLGHGSEVIDRANYRLSFSKMTFPHQLMRLILMEQIYRAFKIMKNEKYHK
ncbi:MAG: 23S rRNA (pseudouridine(1915)-N(3))-methyltransferase RlmH [Thomasclavelia sp.]|nr:23S rRNA (pseudouridine(1915)-N(3))-methyltransferase RlmH [Thomasclavelia sp.]